jgi:hypothetical protein
MKRKQNSERQAQNQLSQRIALKRDIHGVCSCFTGFSEGGATYTRHGAVAAAQSEHHCVNLTAWSLLTAS